MDIPICFHSGGYAHLGPGKVVENDDSDDDDEMMMMMMTLVSPGSGAWAEI